MLTDRDIILGNFVDGLELLLLFLPCRFVLGTDIDQDFYRTLLADRFLNMEL